MTLERRAIFVAILGFTLAGKCEPGDMLENQEYRPYLEFFDSYQQSDAVEVFNTLDGRRSAFDCQAQLDASERARWREEPGEVEVDETPDVRDYVTCLNAFLTTAGLRTGPVQSTAARHWAAHNFAGGVQDRIAAEVRADQERIGGEACGGDQCKMLVVVGDLVVPRVGQEIPVAWDDARDACSRASFGGLTPWRLPTKQDLDAMHASRKLATDKAYAPYWSSTREFDEKGGLKAWVARFDLESLGGDGQPKAMPFDREGVPTRAKVRCVHDLAKAPVESGEVVEMERALLKAGCPDTWSDRIRAREGLLVTWPADTKRAGEGAAEACKQLGWCNLTWRPPAKAEIARFAADPWLADGPDARCVAEVPPAEGGTQ